MKKFLFTPLALLVTATGSFAQVATWDGDTNNLWTVGANWVGDTSPSAGDGLVFAGSTNTNTTNDFAAGTLFSSLQFDAAADPFVLGGNGIVLGGNILFTGNPAAPVTHTIDLDLSLDGDRNVTSEANGNLVLNGVISDDGDRSFLYRGAGVVTVTGANTYGDSTSLFDDVTLVINSLANSGVASALGDGTGTGGNAGRLFAMRTAASATTLRYSGAAASTDRDIRLGTGAHNGASFTLDNQGSGKITFTSGGFNASPGNNAGQNNGTLVFQGTSDIEIQGLIRNQDQADDVLTVEKQGSNTLLLLADSRGNAFGFSGEFNLHGGAVQIGNGGALGKGTFFFRNSTDSKTLGLTAASTSLTVDNDFIILENTGGTEEATFDVGTGQTLEITGNVVSNASADQTFRKTGDGTLILSGTDANTGTADQLLGINSVQAGTLLLNGDMDNGGDAYAAFNVSAGATLGGNGSYGGGADISGALAPGSGGIGTLTLGDSATWNSNDAWRFELGTAAADLASANAATDSDLLDIAGGDFVKGTGTIWTFDFQNSGEQGWYKLVDWTGATAFLDGDFAATNLASGLTGTFTVDSTTSALYLNVVPEPGAGVLLLSGLGAQLLARRRRL